MLTFTEQYVYEQVESRIRKCWNAEHIKFVIKAIMLTEKRVPFGALMGQLGTVDTIQQVADNLCELAELDILNINKLNSTWWVSRSYIIENLPQWEGYPINYKPVTVSSNRGCILGGRLKQHSSEISLDILNKQGAVALKVNPIITSKRLEFSDPQQQVCWNQAQEKYHEIGNQEIYIKHGYDTRGRLYPQEYQLNYQGMEWQKCALQLAEKEMVCLD